MSWIACILSLSGALLSARKQILCWHCWILASGFWISYAFTTKQTPLLVTQMAFMAAGLKQWRKMAKGGK